MSGRPHARRLVALATASVLLLTGCRDPDLSAPPGAGTAPPTDEPTVVSTTAGPAAVVADPRDAVLIAAATDLEATLVNALGSFEALARVTSIEDARPTVLHLRAVLAADPRWQDLDGDGVPDDLGVRPLLPGPISSREETVDYGDAFTAVLTAGRDAGTQGAEFIDLLRDPVISDLGSWQRDAEGMLLGIEAAVAEVTDVAGAEQAVGTITGEGPRALAWALLAVRASDLATLQAYGERGAVHVQLILDALEPLLQVQAETP